MDNSVLGKMADCGRTSPTNNMLARFEYADENCRILAKEIDFLKAQINPKADYKKESK